MKSLGGDWRLVVEGYWHPQWWNLGFNVSWCEFHLSLLVLHVSIYRVVMLDE